MLTSLLIIGIFLIFITTIAFILMKVSTVVIGNDEYGIVFKKRSWNLFQKPIAVHQKIALNSEMGYQPDLLTPGEHLWYWPWIYSIDRKPSIRIEQGEIALVVARYGEPSLPGRSLGCVVDCNDFQDARSFLVNKGQRGEQLGILTTGEYRINTELFDIITTKNARQPEKLRVTSIENNQVGIVITSIGKSLSDNAIAAPSVPDNYNDFQNGEKFLGENPEGYRGLQQEVLKPGVYYLNPWFVEVKRVPMTYIPPGAVGVLFSRTGHNIVGLPKNQLVNLGKRGIQDMPLEPGQYAINTETTKVILVPTSPIILDWSNRQKNPTNYDAHLKPVKLISNDGFDFKIEVTQEIRIQGDQAPKVIAEIGLQSAESLEDMLSHSYDSAGKYTSIRTIVTRILEPTIGNYFRESVKNYDVWSFQQKRDEIQEDAKRSIEAALSVSNIRAIKTLINEIDLPLEVEFYLKERTKIEQRILTEGVRTKEDELRRLREIEETRHKAALNRMESQTDADKVEYLVRVLGVENFLDHERIKQLPNIKIPNTVIGSNSWLDEWILWNMGTRGNPTPVSQTQISAFIDALQGYLKEGGAEKVRSAITEVFLSETRSSHATTHRGLIDSDNNRVVPF